jgi:hypothetical protein
MRLANFLRLISALLLLPLACSFGETFVDSVRQAKDVSMLDVVALLSFTAGIVGFLALWHFRPPVKAYVLGHELTHAAVALLFGAKVSKLKVAASGGCVTVSKSNMMITLSPYFFPFYTILLAACTSVAGVFVSPLPWKPLWFFLAGFTWFFHICFTLDSLVRRQPDIMEFGRIFSYVMIWLFNVGCVILSLVALTELKFSFVFRSLAGNAVEAYVTVYEFIRSLPFLQA